MDISRKDRPSFEVSLTIAGALTVLICGFEDERGAYDVVAGVGETALLPHYISVIKAAVRQLESVKHWEEVDDLLPGDPEGNETLPLPF